MTRQVLVLLLCLGLVIPTGACASADAQEAVSVVLETTLGNIELELFTQAAPVTTASFLAFVDSGRYGHAEFYRVVRPDNDNGSPVITVIQGGVPQAEADNPADRIAHETTAMTGLKHLDGTISLARSTPGSANGAAFFICIGAQPSLDFGGQRNSDGQGFAAFGRVTEGMEVVRAINALRETVEAVDPYVKDQILVEPVSIVRAYRKLP